MNESNMFDKFFSFWKTEMSSFSVNEKNIAILPNLSWHEYEAIAESDPVIQKLITKTQANFNANGWDIKCSIYNSTNKNEKLSREVYQILLKNGIEKLFTGFVQMDSIFGNSFVLFDNDNQPFIQKPSFFNVYWNNYTQKYSKITLLEHNKEIQTFEPFVDIYPLKNWKEQYKPLACSPIDYAFKYLVLRDTAMKVNTKMISRGNIGVSIPIFENTQEMVDAFNETSTNKIMKDQNGVFGTVGEYWTKMWNKMMGGADNSFKTMAMIGIKEIKELGIKNTDMQFMEIVQYCENKIFDIYGIEKSTEKSNRASAQTFGYEIFDNGGRQKQVQFEKMVNEFLIPKLITPILGVEFSENFYFEFNPPNDPDEIARKTFDLSIFIQSTQAGVPLLTQNEIRDKLGLPIAPKELSDLWKQNTQNQLQISSQPLAQNPTQNFENFEKKNPTPTELGLKSKDYQRLETNPKTKTQESKGFLPAWEKAITKQLNAFLETFNKFDGKTISLPKLETFYSFNALKKDLFRFSDFGLEIAKTQNTDAIESKTENFTGYLNEMEIWIENRVESILKGNQTLSGVDEETTNQILNSIQKLYSINQNIDFIKSELTKQFPKIAENRAKLIAETELSNAIEQSRLVYFENEGFQFKKWLTVNDKMVREVHTNNQMQGFIKISQTFSSGEFRAGEKPRCRCSMIYSQTGKD